MKREGRETKPADPEVIELRRSLAQRILMITGKAGEHPTPIPGLSLYYRTTPTPCYRASYEPGLSVFVQGRKRIILGDTEYLCDGSSFLLSSIDVPAQSQIIEASEKTPLLCMFLALDLAGVRSCSVATMCPKRRLYRTVKDWPWGKQRLVCLVRAFACLSFLIRLRTYRSSAT